jgi:hypothetical protein
VVQIVIYDQHAATGFHEVLCDAGGGIGAM